MYNYNGIFMINVSALMIEYGLKLTHLVLTVTAMLSCTYACMYSGDVCIFVFYLASVLH